MTNKELEEKLNELQETTETQKKEFDDIIEEKDKKIKAIDLLLKEHKHLGIETIGINEMLRGIGEAKFNTVNTKNLKINGTVPLTSTVSVRKGDDSGACNLVVEDGIIKTTTC